MWVTKLLISPVKIRIFCPKKAVVGGCGARAVSRKTPIYFINIKKNYLLSLIALKSVLIKQLLGDPQVFLYGPLSTQ